MKTKLIAEIGINHNGDIEVAKKLIDLAYISGWQYAKLQKRTPELCVPEAIRDRERVLWDGTTTTYFEYKKLIEFDHDQYTELFEYAKGKVKLFASVWDLESAKFMAQFTDMVKIPSALITDLELLEFCRDAFDIKIMSTGMSNETQIEKAIETLQPKVIMHTNSTYPSPISDLNLNYIQWIKDKYPKIEAGYSGHEFGLVTTYVAMCMGAKWIERHVTLDRRMYGSDQKSSVEPEGMIKLARNIDDIEKAMSKGYGERDVYESEKEKMKDLRK